MRTAAGFIPSFGAGTMKTRATTQPPVTAKALLEVARRWGVDRVRWALELCFDDLFNQNTWMWSQRREPPLMLITYGASRYDAWAPDGTRIEHEGPFLDQRLCSSGTHVPHRH
jgi:hypothetical protein